MRVLIVEDMPAEAEAFADLVSHHGHQPIVVPSAEAALDSLTVSPPDAILLEMYLPGMSGLEFLRVISERGTAPRRDHVRRRHRSRGAAVP